MKQAHIEVIIASNGQVQVATRGFEGRACLDASRFLERTLGKILDKHLTSEYFDIRGREKARAKLERMNRANQ